MSIEQLLKFYQDDEVNLPNSSEQHRREFPITKMSKALAHSLDYAMKNIWKKRTDTILGLDVGTGKGLHSIVLAINGCDDVIAIDINEIAIELAEARLRRLEETGIHAGVQLQDNCITFRPCDIKIFELENARKFDVMVTNPPSYFAPKEIGCLVHTPLGTGLFDGKKEEADNTNKSFLYKFFERVYDLLAPGGMVVCTWPGLQSRLVHSREGKREPVHPKFLLEEWFGWKVECADTDYRSFFRYRIPLVYENLESEIADMIYADIALKKPYSTLVQAGDPSTGYRPNYPFGVLVLIRDGDKHKQNNFSLYAIDPKIYGDLL